MTAVIKVIASDIANGRPRNEYWSPICHAVRRAFDDGEMEVTLQKKFVIVDGLGKASLPEVALAFTKRFNEGLPVEPFHCELEFK